ncbi:hypothetical protein L1987_20833 [Smallanthus sonchifolius]|uniref:Uncharacterized protein n=1 Tax=Smallanthus sonchifolius TaxID=185202 RepID=A0ACB9ITG2_9ASTR|nr:hypothetical protein L1987_20833 [Smallanthus sonchifolius]
MTGTTAIYRRCFDGQIWSPTTEGVSHTFTMNFTIIDSVNAYLLYVLLRASVSQSPAIFSMQQEFSLCYCCVLGKALRLKSVSSFR